MEKNINVQELLRPRCMVTANYPPSTEDQIGRILTAVEYGPTGEVAVWGDDFDKLRIDIQKYPAIFRVMPWYEKRDIKFLMGLYYKYYDGATVIKPVRIIKDSQRILIHWFQQKDTIRFKKTHFRSAEISMLLPATESEYLAYLKTIE